MSGDSSVEATAVGDVRFRGIGSSLIRHL